MRSKRINLPRRATAFGSAAVIATAAGLSVYIGGNVSGSGAASADDCVPVPAEYAVPPVAWTGPETVSYPLHAATDVTDDTVVLALPECPPTEEAPAAPSAEDTPKTEVPSTETPGEEEPEPTDPEPTDPEPTDPEPTDPEPTDPGTVDPGPSDPAPSDPAAESEAV